MMIQHLNKPFYEFTVNVHGIFIESVIEIVCQLLVLSLSVGRVGKIIFVKGVLEDILGFYDVDWTAPHII